LSVTSLSANVARAFAASALARALTAALDVDEEEHFDFLVCTDTLEVPANSIFSYLASLDVETPVE
jgi:hypothetical protein